MGKDSSGNEVISVQQAEDLKMKEKRKREREVSLIYGNFCRNYIMLYMSLLIFVIYLFINIIIVIFFWSRKICQGRSAGNWKQLERLWKMKIRTVI